MTLDDYFAWRDTLRRLYAEELARDILSDTDAFVNWTYHWREEGMTEAWIRDRIRESPEWQQKHPQNGPVSPAGNAVGISLPCSDTSVRDRLTREQIIAMLPRRGPFQFPAPYNTTGIRLTNEDDGLIEPVGYSYWANANNSAGGTNMLVFIGRTNARPLLLSVRKSDLDVVPMYDLPLNGLGERWYFSKTNPNWLYVDEGMQSEFVRYDVATGQRETIFSVAPDRYLWQAHSSADDRVHSATVRDRASYEMLGAWVYRDGLQTFFPKQGDYDECQIDQSGRWLLIKESSTNRIVDLQQNTQHVVTNEAGAVGHSDNGFGYTVGEDDMRSEPGAMIRWDFDVRQPQLQYFAHDWSPTSRHVSHLNAPEQRVFLSSTCRANSPRANEIVSFPLDGSQTCAVHAPHMCELGDQGSGDDYRRLPKGNIDPTGQFFLWSSNMGDPNGRFDIFAVKVK